MREGAGFIRSCLVPVVEREAREAVTVESEHSVGFCVSVNLHAKDVTD